MAFRGEGARGRRARVMMEGEGKGHDDGACQFRGEGARGRAAGSAQGCVARRCKLAVVMAFLFGHPMLLGLLLNSQVLPLLRVLLSACSRLAFL